METVIHLDHKVTHAEKALYTELRRLHEETERFERTTDVSSYADSLVDLVNRKMMWEEIAVSAV